MKKKWIDPAGNFIPANRVTPLEKKKERYADKIRKTALKISGELSELKELIEKASSEIYKETMSEKNVDIRNKKGNFVWYNFDRTIKIEIVRNDRIDFDTVLIDACKAKLDTFLETNINTENQFIKQLILDAFQTTKGRLDTKRVMGLLKYRSKIDNELFISAMDDLEQSITREFRKRYSRVWLKDDNGEWINIPLDYSDVEPANKEN
jgi:uncharacterized membrane-anchored protein YjiN (DUF445 family)